MFLCVYMQVELRKEFQAQEAALQRSLSKLRSELQKAQEEARENRDKTNRLQTSLANAERTIKVCGWLDKFRTLQHFQQRQLNMASDLILS